MSSTLALAIWFILLVVLFIYDPARDKKNSWTTWVAVVWLAIAASRLPSQWLTYNVRTSAAAMEEGNPFDRVFLSFLIALSIWILISRRFRWGEFAVRHWSLMAFLTFALLSVFWSDFPDITAKRWIRDLGNYLVVLVPLTDPRPLEAIRTTLRRVAYLLVPLSILLIKYFPSLAKQYGTWSGTGYYIGVATSKNMLGALCLVSGIFFIWDSLERWPDRKRKDVKRILWINALLLAMTAWLMKLASSTTSDVCVVLGGLLLIAVRSKFLLRRPGLTKAIPLLIFGTYLVVFWVGLSGAVAQTLGKDPTFTDRTKIWAFLLNMHTDPLIGTGYQSFWLGARLEDFWRNSGLGNLNEAHNGYLETYLELGYIGGILLSVFLIASYTSICGRLKKQPELARLGIAVWLILVFYNLSEAAFNGGVLYSVFLIGAFAPTRRAVAKNKSVSERALANAGDAVPGTYASVTARTWTQR